MKKVVSLIAAAGLTAAAILGAVLSGGSGFWFASAAASVLCCIPFFLSFEKRAPSAGELVLIAVMTAFSAAGRFIFAPVPFFKPVSAIVALAARHLGPQAGFMIGALSAVISNIWFGQGPWTPFQMLCWGLIGAAAGILGKHGSLADVVLFKRLDGAACAVWSMASAFRMGVMLFAAWSVIGEVLKCSRGASQPAPGKESCA